MADGLAVTGPGFYGAADPCSAACLHATAAAAATDDASMDAGAGSVHAGFTLGEAPATLDDESSWWYVAFFSGQQLWQTFWRRSVGSSVVVSRNPWTELI